MGILKKLTERALANLPDFAGEIGKCLPEGERIIGLGQGLPAAHSSAVGGKGLTGFAINKVAQKISENKHVGGDVNSCAKAIPRDLQRMVYIAVTNHNLSVWDFGAAGDQFPPTLLVSFPRSSVAGVASGSKDAYNTTETRFSFVDASFVDIKIYDLGGFDAAAAALHS